MVAMAKALGLLVTFAKPLLTLRPSSTPMKHKPLRRSIEIACSLKILLRQAFKPRRGCGLPGRVATERHRRTKYVARERFGLGYPFQSISH